MPNLKLLGSFEELVLSAVLEQRGNGYGVTIHKALEEAAERTIAVGAMFNTLERLEEKGLVTSWQGEAPERGGRPRRYFKINGEGEQALRDAERARRAFPARRRLLGLSFEGGR